MAVEKKRLDLLVCERYPQYSRQQIQSWIMQGCVTVDQVVTTKAGMAVCFDQEIVLTAPEQKYVCRAGYKLEKALDHFDINPKGLVVLDAGLSTGGFTDCMLQRGAARVYGIDVGYGQVHEKIRQDPRVIVKEKTNLRYLTELPELVDLVTLDLSFISIIKVMNAVCSLLKPSGQLVVLIKPQFESKKHEVGHGGVIIDSVVHDRVVKEVTTGIQQYGFELVGVTESPIKGIAGNKEFLAYFKRKN